MGSGDGRGDGLRDGLRPGAGGGDRPEAETDSSFYNSQVRGKVNKKGKMVVIGSAGGVNRPGLSTEDVKDVLTQAELDDADPLSGQHLPKAQRNHARQYFESLQGK